MARVWAATEHLRSSLWFLPALFAAGAIGLAGLALTIDRDLGPDRLAALQFGGSPEGARSVLATIAQSMLTFTALVFTITMLVLQLASSQLSPRVMRTFLRDRGNQSVLGLFVATFLYTLVVLRDVRSGSDGVEFVPGFAVFLAFALLMASVIAFIYYIDHMAHAIRANSVIESIAAETRRSIDRNLAPTDASAGAPFDTSAPYVTVTAQSSGTLVTIDADGLVRLLCDAGATAALVPPRGDFVPEGAPLFRVRGTVDDALGDRLRASVTLAQERTLQQDIAFGFRQIVDIADRALSPGTNDPTTAVEAIDRLHDLLRRLADRALGPRVHADADGMPRLSVPGPEWADYVRLAVQEIRISGSNQVQVVRRLRVMLDDLANVVTADREAVIRREAAWLERAATALDVEPEPGSS